MVACMPLHDLIAVKSGQVDSSVPSVGSARHFIRRCKPCAFVHTVKGCAEGANCQFCHLCPPGEKRRRDARKKGGRGEKRREDMVRRNNRVCLWCSKETSSEVSFHEILSNDGV